MKGWDWRESGRNAGKPTVNFRCRETRLYVLLEVNIECRGRPVGSAAPAAGLSERQTSPMNRGPCRSQSGQHLATAWPRGRIVLPLKPTVICRRSQAGNRPAVSLRTPNP